MLRILLACLAIWMTPQIARADHRLVFYTGDFPPFAYQESVSQISGPFAEIVQIWCRKDGLRCSMNVSPWKQAQEEARIPGSHIFGLFPMARNADRETWLHFSQPVLASSYGLFVFDSNKMTFSDNHDLAGYNIITFGPSNNSRAAEQIAATIPNVGVTILPDIASMVREMRRPDAHDPAKTVFFGNTHILAWKLGQSGGGPVRFAGQERELLYYIGFPKDSAEAPMIKRFDLFLAQMRESGDLEALLAKWDMTLPPIQ